MLAHRAVEISDAEEKRNENSLKDLWDNIKGTNICFMGIPEGKEKDKEVENTFET